MIKNTVFDTIKNKVIKNQFTIAVVGLGYVGLPLSLSFAAKKIKVYGIDKDRNKIKKLKKKQNYIISVKKNIISKLTNKSFFPTSDFKKIKKSDVIIICVPTPINQKKKPVMKYIIEVIDSIEKYLHKNQTLILECTTYPGTTENFFLPLIKKKKLILGKDFFLGYSPEREDPGNKKFSVLKGNLTKVVSGYTQNCSNLISIIYKRISKKIYIAESIQVAEFSKLLENIYRSVNIGLINELTQISKKMKIDIMQVIKAAKTKPFGFQSFYPGPGVGGHCIPVDPFFLSWKADQLGINLKFIKLAGIINDQRPLNIFREFDKLINKIKLNDKKNYNIVVYGISYKKDSDDTRESPAIKILSELKKNNYQIRVCDPYVKDIKNDNTLKKYEFILKKKEYYNFNNKKDIAIILANHSVFDYKKIIENFKLVIDTRNSFIKNHNNLVQI